MGRRFRDLLPTDDDALMEMQDEGTAAIFAELLEHPPENAKELSVLLKTDIDPSFSLDIAFERLGPFLHAIPELTAYFSRKYDPIMTSNGNLRLKQLKHEATLDGPSTIKLIRSISDETTRSIFFAILAKDILEQEKINLETTLANRGQLQKLRGEMKKRCRALWDLYDAVMYKNPTT